MQYDRGKLKSVVLYTCAKCEPSRLGAVKLHKVLYFADMIRLCPSGNADNRRNLPQTAFGSNLRPIAIDSEGS